MRNQSKILMLGALMLFCLPVGSSLGSEQNQKPLSLYEVPLERLVNFKLITATKKEETLFNVPASAYVLSAEEIRRSGATTIPDALRLVPGVEVARADSSTYAITIRGFNNEHTSKLLVMIDGRSIYSPHFAGVYWDTHDVMLEDVERIEVIRGPGGALWGSNAVNGIINIITKKAKDTQGFLVSAGLGTHEQAFASVRYGGSIMEKVHYRIYTKFFNRDDTPSSGVGDEADDWDALQTGFRIDMQPSLKDQLSIQGNFMSGKIGSGVGSYSEDVGLSTLKRDTDRFVSRNYNLMTKWKHAFSPTSDMALQVYYDRIEYHEKPNEIRDTLDIDFQHSLKLQKHHLTWGLGYRFTTDHTDATQLFTLDPSSQDMQLYSGFVQDEISLADDRLRLTLGIKFEHNKFTNMEYQPNIRAMWRPAERHMLWAAVSRAVRIPSRTDISGKTRLTVWPFSLHINGDDDYHAEALIAYECGYRFKASENFFIDASFFYNDYDDFRSRENKPPRFSLQPFPQVISESIVDNKLEGKTYGVDVSATWDVNPDWKFFFGYSFINIHMHTPSSSTSSRSYEHEREGRSPENQLYLRSYLDLPYGFELDVIVKYVDNLSHIGIHSYTRCDVRIGWQISKDLELSAVGQNLIDSQHVEFVDRAGFEANEIERDFHLKLTWKF